jgi:hypothetical protein
MHVYAFLLCETFVFPLCIAGMSVDERRELMSSGHFTADVACLPRLLLFVAVIPVVIPVVICPNLMPLIWRYRF